MKYDEKIGKIVIGAEEFIAIAQRGILSESADVFTDNGMYPLDEDSKCKNITLELSFSDRGVHFSLKGNALIDNSGAIFLTRVWGGNKKSPEKSVTREARGVGFALAYIKMKSDGESNVTLTIVYINKDTGERVTTTEKVTFSDSEKFFNRCSALVTEYAAPEIERVTLRLASMREAKFPYGKVRDGQDEFIHSVYKSLARGGVLFAMAPTGTGKTVSVLYPTVRAIGAEKCDKAFYFTSKTTTAAVAKECIEEMCRHGVRIRAVMIGAKERICKRGLLCRDGKDSCPSCKGTAVIKAALALFGKDIPVVTENELHQVSREYDVCPHELSLTYSELCDVVILDINYLFDPRIFIKRYFTLGGSFAFLIDEAHNLPDRAREMYSAEISCAEMGAPSSEELGEFSPLISLTKELAEKLRAVLLPYVKDEVHTEKDGTRRGFAHFSEPPTELYSIFERLSEGVDAEIKSTLRAKDNEREVRLRFLRDYKKRVEHISSVLSLYNDGFETFVSFENGDISFKLFCIDPSEIIARRLEKGRATVFFSATLAPISYYRSVLGADRSSSVVEIASPFDPSQISVTVMDKISTRWSEREDTLLAVSRAIAACVSARRGHYMIFSPSFAYSEALSRAFAAKYPKIKVLLQNRDMSAVQKRKFLSEFEKNKDSYLVAFSVTGGIFSEGIDLAGDSLIGAVIVGIGMPALSSEREAIAAYYDEKCDEGKQYAYIYPGMNRVLQAAGRVIRRESDRGVIVLIDDRFKDPIYKKVIPELWSDMDFCDDAKSLRARLDEFWKDCDKTTEKNGS